LKVSKCAQQVNNCKLKDLHTDFIGFSRFPPNISNGVEVPLKKKMEKSLSGARAFKDVFNVVEIG